MIAEVVVLSTPCYSAHFSSQKDTIHENSREAADHCPQEDFTRHDNQPPFWS